MQGMQLANETARVESILKTTRTLLTEVDTKDGKSYGILLRAIEEINEATKLVWDINASAVRDVN